MGVLWKGVCAGALRRAEGVCLADTGDEWG